MRRFLLLMVFASPALYAMAITYTSCTAGTTTLSPCSGIITGPDFGVQSEASAPFLRSGDLSAGVGVAVYS